MKKILLILLVFVCFKSSAQSGYTTISARYNWLAGIFKALGVPSGDAASFTTGQAVRAGAIFYDSTGADSGLYVYSGLSWQRAGSSLDTTSLSNRIDGKIDSITRTAGVDSIYYWKNGVSTAVKDSTGVIPNLIVDSIGVTGEAVIVPRNDTLFHRLISAGSNITVDTLPTGEIRISGNAAGWALTGNSGLSAATNFSGTTDSVDYVMKAYSTIPLRVTASGKLLWDSTNNNPNFDVVFHVDNGASLHGVLIKPKQSASASKVLSVQSALGTELFFITGGGTVSAFSASNFSVASIFNTGADRGRILMNSSAGSNTNGLVNISGGGIVLNDIFQVKNIRNSGANVYANANIINAVDSTNTTKFSITGNGKGYISNTLGIGVTAPSSRVHIMAGTVDTAQLKFSDGVVLTTPQEGAFEYASDVLYFTEGATRKRVVQTMTKNLSLESPTATENVFMFFTPIAITITNTRSVLVGSSTPSVTYNIAFGTDRTTLTNVYSAGQTVTSTTTGTDASGVNDNTIPANSWVVFTTSAQSGTVTQLNTSITYTED